MKIREKISTFARLIFIGKRRLYTIIYIGTILFLFFTFQQGGDLKHTSISSYAYLNGHVIDFYDYNKNIVKFNDYLPLIYILFAIWNSPLKIFGLIHEENYKNLQLTMIEQLWTKTFLVLSFFVVGFILFKIGQIICKEKKDKCEIPIYFLTSPIAIFAVFIFGQYDILHILLMLWALIYYYKNDLYRYSIIMSFAISIKLFPILVYFPLLILMEKRIGHILKHMIILFLGIFVQIAFYWNNKAFRYNIFNLGGDKLSQLKTISLSPFFDIPLFVLLFLLVCVIAYIKKIQNSSELYRWSISLSLLSYAIFFTSVVWHPQWWIMIVPFFALMIPYIHDKKLLFLFDFFGMAVFSIIVLKFWRGNVDNEMLYQGILKNFLYRRDFFVSDIIPNMIYRYSLPLLLIYLYIPFLIKYFQNENMRDIMNNLEYMKRNMIRMLSGILVFIIPCLLCAFAPKDIAQKFNPTAYTKKGLIIESSATPIPIIEDKTFEQSFVSEDDKLSMIGLKLGTYQRDNKEIEFKLKDENGNIIRRDISGDDIKDNDWYYFSFEPIKDSKHQKYVIELTSSATLEEGNCGLQWKMNILKDNIVRMEKLRILISICN